MHIDAENLTVLRAQLVALNRTIARMENDLKGSTKPRPKRSVDVLSRSCGYTLFDQPFSEPNAKEAMISVLRHFAEFEREFPQRFQQAVRGLGRSRRYVGRNPQEIYPFKSKLWKETAEFAPGWYIGTNENNETKRKLLRCACEVIGVSYGVDVIIVAPN